MNRRTKIIVSVAGVFIVLLALLGLTYAYFLTKINGNTNNKSISVSTDNLELTYGDGNGTITGNNIMPGTTLTNKTFSVKNNGSDTNYIVVLDNVSVENSSNNPTIFESNDFIYTLTCTSGCNGVTDEVLPLSNGILVSNDIRKNETQNYTLTVTYKETGVDQSADMGKTLSAKVYISTIEKFNPYASNTNSLAYNIINNSIKNKNGTEFRITPLTRPAEEPSKFNYIRAEDPISFTRTIVPTNYNIVYANDYEINKTTGKFTLVNPVTIAKNAITETDATNLVGKYVYWSTSTIPSTTNMSTIYKVSTNSSEVTISTIKYASISKDYESLEKVLTLTTDDYGVSYYYRGKVDDNYVNFANMCWRIVRIEGDGSIKLILEDQDQTCSNDMDGNWNIPTKINGDIITGNLGYTKFDVDTLTASDGTKNDQPRYIIDYLHGETNSSESMATAFKNFQNTLSEKELSKIKKGNWCWPNKYFINTNIEAELSKNEAFDYKVKGKYLESDTSIRLLHKINPTLKCTGEIMDDWDDQNKTPMYVGGIMSYEIAYSGLKYNNYPIQPAI